MFLMFHRTQDIYEKLGYDMKYMSTSSPFEIHPARTHDQVAVPSYNIFIPEYSTHSKLSSKNPWRLY